MKDEWLNVALTLRASVPAQVLVAPVKTVSQSEGGFEAVHQSVCVVPHWEFVMPEQGPWVVDLRLVLDTSIAAARQLAEASVRTLPVGTVSARH